MRLSKRYILLSLFIFFIVGLHAQNDRKPILVGNVVSDTISFEEITSPFKSDFLPSILKSTNTIEIRFFEVSREKGNCTVLTFNEKWKVKRYQSKSNSWDEIEVVCMDSVFNQLVLNNIFSLPDEDDLPLFNTYLDIETNEMTATGLTILDGTCNVIEFKVRDNYRRYKYCNPEVYSDYLPHINELRNAVEILEIVNKLIQNRNCFQKRGLKNYFAVNANGNKSATDFKRMVFSF